MQKKFLLTAALLLTLSNSAFCASAPQVPNQNVHPKACQNTFSFINIDLSFMSPRAAMTDSQIEIQDNQPLPPKKGEIVPIADKRCQGPCPMPPTFDGQQPLKAPEKNKTSLFRLDLFHFFKLQIL